MTIPHIQLPIKVKHSHDEIRESSKTPVIAYSSCLQAMLLFQLLPLLNMLAYVVSRLWPVPTLRRSDSFQTKELADDGPLLAPRRGFGRVGNVKGLSAATG